MTNDFYIKDEFTGSEKLDFVYRACMRLISETHNIGFPEAIECDCGGELEFFKHLENGSGIKYKCKNCEREPVLYFVKG